MSNDSNVQGFYGNGVSHPSSSNAGQWQAQNNPGHQPGQQSNESWQSFSTRVNAQNAATKKD